MGRFWKIQRGGGSYEKSLPWGGYGYFLEPHIEANLSKGSNSLKYLAGRVISFSRYTAFTSYFREFIPLLQFDIDSPKSCSD